MTKEIVNEDTIEKDKIIIGLVFAQEVSPKGELGNETTTRLLKALELYRSGKINRIIVSGGKIEDMEKSAAKYMKEFLVLNGVPGNFIITEDESLDTAQNILFSFAKIVWHPKFKDADIYFVSSEYHIDRIKQLLEGMKIDSKKHKFEFPEDFNAPQDIQKKIVEIIAGILLKIEPDGQGSLHALFRRKFREPKNY